MKKRKVIVRVVDAGSCRYYRKGRTFVLGGFTPKGLCDSAYAVLSRDAQTIRCGGKLPWENDGQVLTRCPDPDGALWELRLEGARDACRAHPVREEVPAQQPKGNPTPKVQACRGREGGCPFALIELANLKKQVEAIVERSGWEGFLRKRFPDRILPHQRLKLALAACPNTCTQPQIKDIGVVAMMRPIRVTAECNACGQCQQVCEEGAIVVRGDQACLAPDKCVACGLCVEHCPQNAIETEGLSFRILVGGKVGRRPTWARELSHGVSAHEVPGVISKLLSWIMENTEPEERIADVVDRIGPDIMLAAIMDLCHEAAAERGPPPL